MYVMGGLLTSSPHVPCVVGLLPPSHVAQCTCYILLVHKKRMLIPALISIQPAHQCHTPTVYVCTYVHIYNKVYVCYTQNKLECTHTA